MKTFYRLVHKEYLNKISDGPVSVIIGEWHYGETNAIMLPKAGTMDNYDILVKSVIASKKSTEHQDVTKILYKDLTVKEQGFFKHRRKYLYLGKTNWLKQLFHIGRISPAKFNCYNIDNDVELGNLTIIEAAKLLSIQELYQILLDYKLPFAVKLK